GVPGSAARFEHAPALATEEERRLYVSPPSRVRLARALAAAGGVRAAIDLSDGLAADLARLCDAGRGGARIGSAVTDPMLAGSDDYELLLAIDPGAGPECRRIAAAHGVPVAVIGEVTDAPGIRQRQPDGGDRPLEPRGWDHFAADPKR